MYFSLLRGGTICQVSDGPNLVVSLDGGSIEVSGFGADVNNCAPLNYSVFTRQVQLAQGTILGGITNVYIF